MKFRIVLRLFEICTSRQYVELKPESEEHLVLDHPIQDIHGKITENRLSLFVKFRDAEDRFSNETVYVYLMSKAFALNLEKQIYIPPNLRLNILTH